MREASPHHLFLGNSLTGFRPSAKSLFQNILAVSPCGSRFCEDHFRSKLHNSFGINILEILTEKMWSDQSHAKSLFWKILPVSPCGSIFCADSARSEVSKSLRMNILKKSTEKMYGLAHASGVSLKEVAPSFPRFLREGGPSEKSPARQPFSLPCGPLRLNFRHSLDTVASCAKLLHFQPRGRSANPRMDWLGHAILADSSPREGPPSRKNPGKDGATLVLGIIGRVKG